VTHEAGGMPEIIWHDSVGSTNAEALALYANGQRSPVWVAAGEQTAGRGREGRAWVSTPGNLYASLLWPVANVPVERLTGLSLVAGLAVADAFVAAGPNAAIRLKWPNDVLIGGRKAAGILIETTGQPGDLAAIIGCGLNLAHHPDGTRWPATHLAAHRRPVDPRDMLGLLAASMEVRLEQWDQGRGFASIRDDWQTRALGLGTRISLATGETGRFSGLSPTGALEMERDDGSHVVHHAGDVEWLDARPEEG
jgi:BirA family biotin operon repressor/biotin-[acetyl-CoA-carboxylase] ligase